jgi:hypothetical protein
MSLKPPPPSFVLKEFKYEGKVLWIVPEVDANSGCEHCVIRDKNDPCGEIRYAAGVHCVGGRNGYKTHVIFLDPKKVNEYIVDAIAAKLRNS